MQPLYAFDAKGKRKLVGYATNVFVGRVAEEVGSEGAPLSGPRESLAPDPVLHRGIEKKSREAPEKRSQ